MNIAKRFLYALLAGFLLLSLSAVAQKNLVYINGNITTANQNGVIVLVNDGNGNMSALAGSPFLTGGTGVGAPPSGDADWDSDGEVIINATGTRLFAVNGHTNTIAAFRINANGTLTPAAGSPFPSGGPQPASIAYKDNALGGGVSMMVVANKDSDPLQTATIPNYTTFTVAANGVLTMNPGSTVTLPAGSSPAQVMFRKGAVTGFFGVEFMAGTFTSYKLDRSGIATVTNSMTMPGPVPVGVGAALQGNVRGIYLTLPGDNGIAVYGYDTTGKLNFLRTVPNQGAAVCWAAVNAAGTRLYTSETASGTMTVYDVSTPSTPVQLQHMAVSGTGALPIHMKVDPTGKFLYVLDRLGVLHVMDILADGTVAENHTPFNLGLPAGTVPLGVSVLQK